MLYNIMPYIQSLTDFDGDSGSGVGVGVGSGVGVEKLSS